MIGQPCQDFTKPFHGEPMTALSRSTTLARYLAVCALAAVLTACGGGGGTGGAGCTTIDPTRPSSLPGCGSSTPTTPTVPTTPVPAGATLAPVTLALTDAAGAAIITVTPDKPGMVLATVKDSTGGLQSNVTVTLSSTDSTATYLPAAGSALTDAAGVARIGLPAGTRAGAYTLTASAAKSGLTSTGTMNYAVLLSNQPVVIAPLTMSMADSAGVAMTTVTPERSGVLAATVKDSTGVPLPNVAVSFTSSDTTAAFAPASGTALTDALGVARVGVPVGGQGGGFIARAVATAGSATASGAFGYSVSFPALTLSALRVNPTPLSVGGTATIDVTVLNGATAYTQPLTVTFTSTCAANGKATLGLPVLTVAGIATTSYVDKGCGAPDPITASVTMGGITTTQTGTVSTLGTIGGQIAFVSALPTNIALKGTGGAGRQESSVVTFKVLDRSGNIVPGVTVNFALFGGAGISGTGAVTLSPASATSRADGTVVTTVLAGTVNTPIRVLASIAGSSPIITTLSDQLVVSTGIPHQNSFSLSTETYNVEGISHDGCGPSVGSRVRVSMADHFGNPVPDGTAVSFTAERAVIDASCQTTAGVCSVNFCSANPRQDDNRITILAYALGEESYSENPILPNSINRYDLGEAFDDLCEPVRIDNALTNAQANANNKDSRVTACRAPAVGEVYIDTNGNGSFSTTGDGLYNGVLNVDPATGQTTANNRTSTIHVRGALVQVLSTSEAAITSTNISAIAIPACVSGTQYLYPEVGINLAIRDLNPTIYAGNTLAGNVLPAGTSVTFAVSNGTISNGMTSYIVSNTNNPAQAEWLRTVAIRSDATQTAGPAFLCTDAAKSGVLTVTVTSPLGTITKASYPITD
jgi:hypothetical protein